MQDLTVVGVENGVLLVASLEGAQYRVEVDDGHLAQLRRARPLANEKKVPPREIQSHIRAGMSAEDVAELTGADLGYVERFVGPVMAEREFVIESALNVTVHTPADTDPLDGSTFGSVIRDRLAEGGATNERWASWKDPESGWIVKLTFTAETVERDARWGFDPRKQALSPLNSEAISLSQQGEMPASLIPRLRAVPLDERGETGRFDSGAFQVSDDHPSFAQRAADAAVTPMNQTADLLEALRRRRGERDSRVFDEEPDFDPTPPTATIRLVDVPMESDDSAQFDEDSDGIDDPAGSDGGFLRDGSDDTPRQTTPHRTAELPDDLLPVHERPQHSTRTFDEIEAEPDYETPSASIHPMPSHATAGSRAARKGRASMPSWDEIVFGARSDDDL